MYQERNDDVNRNDIRYDNKIKGDHELLWARKGKAFGSMEFSHRGDIFYKYTLVNVIKQ